MDGIRDDFETAWMYLRRAAKVMGAKGPLDAGSAERKKSRYLDELSEQENYSVGWFFEESAIKTRASKSALTQAFLGLVPVPERTQPLLSPHFPASSLSDSQRAAVQTSLNQAVSVIHGPPGTGKTTVIIELLKQIEQNGRTAVVVSQNQAAIQNVVERIQETGRGAREPGSRLADRFAELGNKDRRKNFQDPEREFIFGRSLSNNRENVVHWADFRKRFPIFTSTLHSLFRCFADSPTASFDYVIVDEASQVSPLFGLIATVCAKSLIVIGDHHQLPPILDSTTERIINWVTEDVHPKEDVALAADRSFLDVWRERLTTLNPTPTAFLAEHYRCHPGIIEFCNKYIYDNQLIIKTQRDSCRTGHIKMPIRVRWFEGNYGEPCDIAGTEGTTGKQPRRSRRNLKQIEVFMEEEWPPLKQRLAEDPGLSVCVLSPYRGQLAELKRRLDEDLGRAAQQGESHLPEHASLAELEPCTPETVQTISNGNGGRSPSSHPAAAPLALTIHKAQGREYDIVYLLPVDDALWEWPWSQKKRLVNVAVSRAKEELVIIISASLMSDSTRTRLPQMATPPSRSLKDSPDELWVQKLVEYVQETHGGEKDYGLVRSEIRSVFDGTPTLSTIDNEPGRKEISNPELFFSRGFAGSPSSENLVLLREVRLGSFIGEFADDETKRMRADFVIVEPDKDMRTATGGRVVAVVEIDGRYHRENSSPETLADQHIRDQQKDRAIDDAGGRRLNSLKTMDVEEYFSHPGKFVYMRIPTDGTSRNEFTASPISPDAMSQIDSVLNRQLSLGIDEPVKISWGLSLTKYLQRHVLHRTSLSSELTEYLVDKGYLTETRGPTQNGFDQGIIHRLCRNENRLFWNSAYDPEDPWLKDLVEQARSQHLL